MATTISQRLEQSKRIRDAILDRMEGRIAENHNSYSVNDRSISKMTIDELGEALDFIERHIRKLERRFNRASGVSNMIKVRL